MSFFKLFFNRKRLLPCLALLFTMQSVCAGTELNVLVSIKPLHALVAAVMQGAGEPALLPGASQSPHHASLRPSDYRKIAAADIVFWAGPALEVFLPAIIERSSDPARFIALMQADGVQLLPLRSRHYHPADDAHHHDHKPASAKSADPHFWLSPGNAKHIVNAVAATLIQHDGDNAERYRQNRDRVLQQIEDLHQSLRRQLQNLNRPFITYHDAYQYFEQTYHLNRLASVTRNEETPPGIKQLRQIKKLIETRQVHCLFYEAPRPPPVLATLRKNTALKTVELDAIGIQLPAGDTLWFRLMNKLGDNFAQCLKEPLKAHLNKGAK